MVQANCKAKGELLDIFLRQDKDPIVYIKTVSKWGNTRLEIN